MFNMNNKKYGVDVDSLMNSPMTEGVIVNFKGSVQTVNHLPSESDKGDVRFVENTKEMWMYENNEWQLVMTLPDNVDLKAGDLLVKEKEKSNGWFSKMLKERNRRNGMV